MGELKSALELALEKTKKIKTTQEEREQIRKQEFISQATGLLSRYLSGGDRIEDLEKVLGENEQLAKEFLSLLWAKLKTVSDINQRLLAAISRFQQSGESIASEIAALQQEYQRLRGEKLKDTEKIIIEKLAERGIKGSAIIPNPTGSREGMQLFDALEKEYSSKLQEIIKDFNNSST